MQLFGLDRAELSRLCERLGQPVFRGKQIADWLYKKSVHDISQMTNLPASMREQLSSEASLYRASVEKESRASDGTTKYLLKMSDGETIESVFLPYSERTSVCVSTQIGCRMGCVFCATAECGFVRNLTAGEIVDEVLTLQEHGGRRITHVVYMGMGEPLLNFENVIKSLHLLNDEVGISMRRLTVSTVGIPPAIRKLRDMDLQITLAISLHAPDDKLRREIIPLSAKYPIQELISTCRDYADFTKRRITFEYLLLDGINDTPDHAVALSQLLRHTLCNVNLIPYNEVSGKIFRRPSQGTIRVFRSILEDAGIEVTQRMEKGHSIAGACGQLKRGHIQQPNVHY